MYLSQQTKQAFLFLLQPGNYMRVKANHNKDRGFTLYCGKQIPMRWCRAVTIKPLLQHTREEKGIIRINLSSIRQLHGNSSLKKIYKADRKKTNEPVSLEQ
jgi:hypothetical protein